jgi:hypothetical protein
MIGVVASATVAAIVVSCGGGGSGYGGGSPATPAATFGVSGNVTGTTAATVVKLNGGSDVPLTSAGGAFSFTGLADGTTFNVQVVNGTDRCAVSSNGAGTLAGADVTGVAVTCIAQGTQKVVRSARLTGAQETPAVVTVGNGTGGIIFDPASTGITGGVTVFGITPASVSLMQGASGTAGTQVVQLGTAGDGHTFFIPASTTLTAGQITALFAGQLYFDVFTAAHPATGTGEIRGQLELQSGVLAAVADMDFAQETAGGTDLTCTGKTTTGQGTVIVDRATRLILTSYMTHNVTNANLSHIHTSTGPTTAGGVIINFVPGPTLAYPSDTTVPLSAVNVSDFLADFLYFNIHSATDGCPSGEIRGNIAHIP